MKNKDSYLPSKIFMFITEKLYLLHYFFEQYTYKKMNDRLDYLYENGMFDEARTLINSVETNTTTVKMPIDLRLKEMDYNEKEN